MLPRRAGVAQLPRIPDAPLCDRPPDSDRIDPGIGIDAVTGASEPQVTEIELKAIHGIPAEAHSTM